MPRKVYDLFHSNQSKVRFLWLPTNESHQDNQGECLQSYRSYQNDEEPDKRDELEKQQAERQKAIANFIGQNYSPIGTTSQKSYKTTAELVYELSNIVDVAPMALAKQLADAGYHVEYLAGQPYWVMYERA